RQTRSSANNGARGGFGSSQSGSSAVLSDELAEPVEYERLRHEVDRPELQRLLRRVSIRSDDDDRDPGQARVAQLTGTEVPTVQDRHEEIEEDEAEPLGGVEHAQRGLAVLGLDDAVALALEERRDRAPETLVVLDDEDAAAVLRHDVVASCSPGSASSSDVDAVSAGSTTVNVAPLSSPSLSAVSEPPCWSTRLFAIVRPRPRPPPFRRRTSSPWRKGSKTCGRN